MSANISSLPDGLPARNAADVIDWLIIQRA